MKIVKRLLPFLLVVLAVLAIGCSHGKKTEIEKVITSELDRLKNLDSATTQKYISYKELFPDVTEETELSAEVNEVFSLFFQNFNYKILDINVDNKQKAATADIRLSTIDAKTLAKDFAHAYLKEELMSAADSATQNTKERIRSLEERYLILNQLLKENAYESVETNCTMELRNTGDDEEVWEITRTHSLENDLVGGLMTYLSDNDILSPEETLTVYLNTLKEMNMEQMSNYLGAESILSTEDSDKNAIASALVELVHDSFDFEIQESTVDGYTASIDTVITTFDCDTILAEYQKELDAYLALPEAVIDGSEIRHEKAHNLMLESIENHPDLITVSTTFALINDGVSWKLQDDGQILGNAIFGTLSTTPLDSEETEEKSES